MADSLSFNASEWKFHDSVNEVDEISSFNILSATSMSITAAGNDVWTGADEYGAYYLEDIEGDFSVTVKITSQDNTNGWAKAGIMVRNDISNDGQSPGYCMVAVTPGNGFAFQWDNNNNGLLDRNENTRRSPSSSYPCWLKLVKQLDNNKYNFTGFYSLDGTNWIEIKSKDLNQANGIQDVGLFVTSHDKGDQCVVNFEDFDTDNGPIPTTYTITVDSGENGSISVENGEITAGLFTATKNSEPVFNIVPDTGYEISDVTVDFSSVLPLLDDQYTFSPVSANHTIRATFSQFLHTITASASSNGSISPSGSNDVVDNADIIFDVVPDEGYMVDVLTVDGDNTAVLTDDQYEFLDVTEDHTISVTFKESSDDDPADNGIPGCSTNTTTDYSGGFNASNFSLENTSVSTSGVIELDTGNEAINPDNIEIPFTQEVFVTFLYEGAGYVSDFGWMLKEDAVEADGTFKGWDKIPLAQRHPLFIKIYDDNETGGCCSGGDGVLDTEYGNGSFPTSSETALAAYDDGTDYPFVVNGDGKVSPLDMKKSIGTIAGGTELVFFLTASKRWDNSDPTRVFFTKKDWNPDTYGACGSGTFDKIYKLGESGEGSCTTEGGWLASPAITRMASYFDVTLSGEYKLPITWGAKYSHVIVGAPPDKPNKWILGWEDLMGGGDADHNDMVFQIERRTGGIASLQSSAAIVPEDEDAYFTAVTFVVYDNMPCSGLTEIDYSISIDNGDTWIEITDWDEIYATDATKNITGSDPETGWVYGTPQYTKRKVRLDFSEKGLSGRALLWKAEMFSDKETCIPQILDVLIDGTVATNGSFSRAEPVVQTNVVYSGTYETPAISWTDKVLRGHLVASQLYVPEDPNTTAVATLWDAGEVLQLKSPVDRKIYYPYITHGVVVEESLGIGDGAKVLFSGTFAHHPVSALTVNITDTTETFKDEHTDVLTGSLGGVGTINRFTGEYSFSFNTPPENGVPVKASYSYYTASSILSEFTISNITNAMLGLDSTYIIPDGYVYDMNDDDALDESDGDWLVNWVRGYKDGSSTSKEWLLGPIDHSVPAVQIPPGIPRWYYGTAITDDEREDYDAFLDTWKERPTVVYVGSRDGMLHAFDGGKFRSGDNPDTTSIEENRGYFLWESGVPNYGTGEELWAFIPANLISRLKNNYLKKDDQAYVDASPTIADVNINSSWKTVLLCAQGNGGDTVSCLDVTNPADPSFMWEFADPDLYRSRSSAAVSQIGRILVSGSPTWVAFFVSGKTYDDNLYPSVYIVNIEDGSLIQRVFLDDDPDGTARGKGGTASGQPAVVDSDENGYIDRIYIGSDKGYMYKINIPDDPDSVKYGITNCVINTDFTDDDGNAVATKYQFQPVYASPSVITENTFSAKGELEYHVKIFFGTGDSPYYDEDINTADTRYHFFAYEDTSDKGAASDADVKLDWYMKLEEGHRVFASAFAAAGNIYFGTSTAETEDPCEAVDDTANSGKTYAVDIEDGTVNFELTTGNVRVPPLITDEHLYIKTPEGNINPFGGGPYNNPVSMGATVTTSVRSWKELSE
ncbi:PilC/PilY family type IV pilus protein [Desulfocicer vacuolatum]|nr:PilC/PilY family type IV pilus protein [Desulfocicer vacuolatum]